MKFQDVVVNKKYRFSLGRELDSGRYYLSIPVSNRLADYEEYYEIDSNQFQMFQGDEDAAELFAQQCREQKLDHLLVLKPGKDRGVAI